MIRNKFSPKEFLPLLLLWIASAIVANPIGDFPLNDDWSFAVTTRRFYETGTFHPLGWAAMPQLTNTLWGSLFLLPDGFSFTALRISTLTISIAGTIAIYSTLRFMAHSKFPSYLAAITFGFTPIYYSLSFSYMTDVPYVALIAISCHFLLRTLQEFNWKNYCAGVLFILAAMLSRQLALSVAIGFAAAYILRYERSLRNVSLAILPLIVCIISYILLKKWLTATGRLPALFDSSNSNLINALINPKNIFTVFNNFYIVLMYFGLFLSPLSISAILIRYRSIRKLLPLILILISIIITGLLRWKITNAGFLMPLSGNILNVTGLGAPTLFDAYIAHTANMPTLSKNIRLIITSISMISSAAIIFLTSATAYEAFKDLKEVRINFNKATIIFSLTAFASCIFPFLVVGLFDRYLLAGLPMLFIFLAATDSLKFNTILQKTFSIIATSLLVVFSVAATHDHLSWNKARWEAIKYLKRDIGAADSEIDGGFEFNGLCCYDPEFKKQEGKSWWWVTDDFYRVGFNVSQGHEPIKYFPYTKFLPFETDFLVATKRKVH